MNYYEEQAYQGGYICAISGKDRKVCLGLENERKAWFDGYDNAIAKAKRFTSGVINIVVRRRGNIFEKQVDNEWVRFVPNQVLSCSEIDALYKLLPKDC